MKALRVLVVVDGRYTASVAQLRIDDHQIWPASNGDRFVPHVFISGDAATVQAVKPTAAALQKPFDETD